ncbi:MULTISPECIES: C39 family peptidase [Photorhabdus]|uniref:C39 family peptidase n=1 Tax=Photorhabdus TaxID=29487 RepID=UPI000DCE2F01|nr:MULTISPECIES: cysteine peptidase family C39 domain-containing protein [Photorhabdus]MCT8342768.1 peptidase [Photorhabdus kleinii]RAW99492.1 peptidase [Photorhabdus sp. S10-54]RAW99598.1 peptidase [Photorhabdus sp. S9-53]RAX03805.1 peptidase [Photorhabdus sp. S8-52]
MITLKIHLRTTLIFVILVLFAGQSSGRELKVSNYIDLKFKNIVRQEYDFTCGLASLINILATNYQINIEEEDLIKITGIKPEYSFIDLQNTLKKFDILSMGVKISLKQLEKVNSPTILYLKRNGTNHFVIFNGIDSSLVQIIDPAWGNINYTRSQFERYWLQDNQLGRALILMKKTVIHINHDYVYRKSLF